MTDIVDPGTRSRMMAGIKGKNSAPEMIVRSGLHRRGFRFRLHDKSLLGKPDIVLPKYNAVINIHGCFWHGHEQCRYFKLPSTRPDFWQAKIYGNRVRDRYQYQQLLDSGWRVMTIWECALRSGKPIPRDEIMDSLSLWLKGNCRTGFIDETHGFCTSGTLE